MYVVHYLTFIQQTSKTCKLSKVLLSKVLTGDDTGFFTSQFIQQSKVKFSNWFKEAIIFSYYNQPCVINQVHGSGHSMCIHFLFSFLDSHEITFKRSQTYPCPVELYQNCGFSTFLLLGFCFCFFAFFFSLSLFSLSFSFNV